jgi:hypothetical protein
MYPATSCRVGPFLSRLFGEYRNNNIIITIAKINILSILILISIKKLFGQLLKLIFDKAHKADLLQV